LEESSKIERMNLQISNLDLFKTTLSDPDYCFVGILESEDENYIKLRAAALDMGASLVYKSEWSLILNTGQIRQKFYLYELQGRK